VTLATIVCCTALHRCLSNAVLFSIWNLAPATRSEFLNLYRDAVMCGAQVECPQFTPNLHKFDNELPSDNSTDNIYPEWTRESMSASRRAVQLRMSAAKALDVAAARALGCSPLYMQDSMGLERDSNSTLITRMASDYKHCPTPAAARDAVPTANIITPCVMRGKL
jgi:hypothetical protein